MWASPGFYMNPCSYWFLFVSRSPVTGRAALETPLCWSNPLVTTWNAPVVFKLQRMMTASTPVASIVMTAGRTCGIHQHVQENTQLHTHTHLCIPVLLTQRAVTKSLSEWVRQGCIHWAWRLLTSFVSHTHTRTYTHALSSPLVSFIIRGWPLCVCLCARETEGGGGTQCFSFTVRVRQRKGRPGNRQCERILSWFEDA